MDNKRSHFVQLGGAVHPFATHVAADGQQKVCPEQVLYPALQGSWHPSETQVAVGAQQKLLPGQI